MRYLAHVILFIISSVGAVNAKPITAEYCASKFDTNTVIRKQLKDKLISQVFTSQGHAEVLKFSGKGTKSIDVNILNDSDFDESFVIQHLENGCYQATAEIYTEQITSTSF